MLIFIFLIIVFFVVNRHSLLDNSFYQIKQINPHLNILENNHNIFLEELLKAENYWLNWPETYLYQKDNWKIIPIYAFDKWINIYKKQFPKTIKILSHIPNIKTILFSRVKANSSIKPHQGWAKLSNYILRCHLPIILDNNPKHNFLSVNNLIKNHQLGKLIIFDDSKEHYSVNNSSKDRVVLIIDIKRPFWVKTGSSQIKETPQLNSIIKTYLK